MAKEVRVDLVCIADFLHAEPGVLHSAQRVEEEVVFPFTEAEPQFAGEAAKDRDVEGFAPLVVGTDLEFGKGDCLRAFGRGRQPIAGLVPS